MQSLIQIPKAEPLRTALVLDADISETEWVAVGVKLMKMAECVQWWLGDWLNFGEAKWGEKYLVALDITGYSVGTLRNYSYVSYHIDSSLRSDKLTFAHHQVVAPMGADEQKRWLSLAESSHWSVVELRAAIRYSEAEPGAIAESSPEFSPVKWAQDFCRWTKQTRENWSGEQREAVKRQLEPIVRIYESL